MWTCPKCGQQFLHTNQRHSCNDRTVQDFLDGKSAHTLALYDHFLEVYRGIGDFVLHPAKTRIALANKTRFCSINQLGRNFLHVVFQFDQPYNDNYCFIKVAQIPETHLFNHHCRVYAIEDVNEEVRMYMKMAFDRGNKLSPDQIGE